MSRTCFSPNFAKTVGVGCHRLAHRVYLVFVQRQGVGRGIGSLASGMCLSLAYRPVEI
jgi:hypothetical protein